MAASVYSVTLHHLSPDAKVVGHGFPEQQLAVVTVAQLRDLLFAFSLAAEKLTIYEPGVPEIRIKSDRDAFIVRTRYRRLCFVGHETVLRGEEHSVAYILTVVTGSAEAAKPSPRPDRTTSSSPMAYSRPPMPAGRVPRWVKLAVMVVIIIAANGTAVWLLLRPPRTLNPTYELLPDQESQALVAKTVGEYRTGSNEGDRRLVINRDGTLRIGKFGPKLTVGDESTRSVRGGLMQGRTVLVTNDPYVLAIRDADTLVLYGNIFHRHTP